MRISLLLLLTAWNCFAATYYVRKDGSDSNTGTADNAGGAWLTIQKAATTASAGDTVNVRQGEYQEYVTCANSGTASSRIVFNGERGGSGEWLTIIDPSTNISTGWVAAPEVASGVWKITNMPFAVREMTITNQRVAFVYTNGLMINAVENAYGTGTGISNGIQFLALSTTATLPLAQDGNRVVEFWDGVEALYCAVATNTVYLRLRDGSDPNGMDIRAAKNLDSTAEASVAWPAVTLEKSFVTWQNFKVRGAFAGFFIGQNDNGNLITSNYIANGQSRVFIYIGASTNTVSWNDFTCDYYGWSDPGAWGGDDTDYSYIVRANLYAVSKFLMGVSSTFEYNVQMSHAGTNNVIFGNRIFKGLGTGISVIGSSAFQTRATFIISNSISGQTSIGIGLNEYHSGTKVLNNYISDNNTNIRLQHLDQVGETDRTVYIYRNRFWQPEVVGDQLYFDFYNSSGPESFFPTHWIYHNSFLGGEVSVTVSAYAYGSGGITNCNFLNNIFTGTNSTYFGNVSLAFWEDPAMVTIFDYNLLTHVSFPSVDPPDWYGANNLTQVNQTWAISDTNFVLTAASPAVNSAIDVYGSFVIDGITYGALPQGTEERNGVAWDMGALEFVIDAVPAVIGPGKPNKGGRPRR